MVTAPTRVGAQLVQNPAFGGPIRHCIAVAVISVTALRSANVNPIIWAYRDLH